MCVVNKCVVVVVVVFVVVVVMVVEVEVEVRRISSGTTNKPCSLLHLCYLSY